MPESLLHMNLVNMIVEKIKCNYEITNAILNIDAPDQIYNKPPILYEGYSPDVYYKNKSFLVIGEAKTENDALSKHSLEQYKCYLAECCAFKGFARLIIAVPWTVQISVKNKIRKFCYDIGFELKNCIVINEIGIE